RRLDLISRLIENLKLKHAGIRPSVGSDGNLDRGDLVRCRGEVSSQWSIDWHRLGSAKEGCQAVIGVRIGAARDHIGCDQVSRANQAIVPVVPLYLIQGTGIWRTNWPPVSDKVQRRKQRVQVLPCESNRSKRRNRVYVVQT